MREEHIGQIASNLVLLMRNSEVIKITVRRPGLKSESYYLLAIEEVISPLSLSFFFSCVEWR